MRRPRHVAEVRLSGTRVEIPPAEDDAGAGAGAPESGTDGGTGADERLKQLVIDRFEAPDTVLTIIPKKPGKPPKVFTIHHLVMESVGRGQTIPYIAVLTNPIPKGQIEASGTFGPWNVPRPARTSVRGTYTFANADLNTIDGLAGILSSEGTFEGPLNRIRVQGQTATPQFQVDAGGAPVPLTTSFTAVVDGSDGDTILERVDARFLDTGLTATGAVIGLEGVPGRRIEVDVTDLRGRVEDVLKLAIDARQPLLRGGVQMKAHLVIPPRKAKVLDKLDLRGAFGLSQAKFTDPTVQKKIVELSRHGQGKQADDSMGQVMSSLRGSFAFTRAVASFSRLRFGVPGAVVDLKGTYSVRSENIDFHGHLIMDAPLSKAAGGGLKSFFLKAVDPFFRKNGAGTVLPIKIVGNRRDPKFGLELFK